MSVAQEFRARAAYCIERAAEMSDPSLRRDYEMIAQKWIDLAIEEEEREVPEAVEQKPRCQQSAANRLTTPLIVLAR
jgi:hypothetical protein